MTWGEPRWLLALLLLPFVGVALVLAANWNRQQLRRVFSAEILSRVVPDTVRRRRATRDALVLLGLAGIFVALAEPRFDKVVRTLQVKGSDVVVLLDLSRSMDARDVDPSRLERARREIEDLGALLAGDRVGLVVFAGGAYPRLPLTADFRALQLVVNEATTEDFDTQGSDLGAAIQAGLELLSRSQEKAGQAMLVLSDGEVHDVEGALASAGDASARNIPIFVMGIGSAPSTIPTPDGGVLEWKGEVVKTAPDFEVLKQVAQRTGGAFVVSNPTSNDMGDLYGAVRRSVTAIQRSVQQRETYNSGFQYPLGVAAILLLVAAWLGEGRRAFGAAAVALLFLSAPPSAHAADPLTEADQLFRAEKYPQAAEKLVELSLERPDDPEVFERLGAARYRAGDYEGAAQAYDRAADLSDDPTVPLYNSGNAHYRAGRLEDALGRYEEALGHDPDMAQAQQNRDLVQKEIQTRRQPPPPPPPQGGGEQDQPPPQGGEQPPPQMQPGEDDPRQPPQGDNQPQGAGEPQDPEEAPPMQGQSDSEGQRDPSDEPPDPSGSSDAVDPNQVEGEQDSAPGAGGAGKGEPAGPITASQADRLLDSVEEGHRRVVVQGQQDGPPW